MYSARPIVINTETKRASAYSADLRWRMIWQREVLGMTNREIEIPTLKRLGRLTSLANYHTQAQLQFDPLQLRGAISNQQL